MSQFSIVFVCTGNTCRSPLAAALAGQLLAGLGERVRVSSAGLAAVEGQPASAHARFVAQGHGGSLENHRSRPFDARVAQQADLVVTMTAEQLEVLRHRFPDLRGEAISLVELSGRFALGDVNDPFGGTLEGYEETYRQIEAHLRAALPAMRHRVEAGLAAAAADRKDTRQA